MNICQNLFVFSLYGIFIHWWEKNESILEWGYNVTKWRKCKGVWISYAYTINLNDNLNIVKLCKTIVYHYCDSETLNFENSLKLWMERSTYTKYIHTWPLLKHPTASSLAWHIWECIQHVSSIKECLTLPAPPPQPNPLLSCPSTFIAHKQVKVQSSFEEKGGGWKADSSHTTHVIREALRRKGRIMLEEKLKATFGWGQCQVLGCLMRQKP